MLEVSCRLNPVLDTRAPMVDKKGTMQTDNEIIDNIANKEYEFGFVTDIEMDIAPVGLDESTIHYISEKRKSPSGCSIGG